MQDKKKFLKSTLKKKFNCMIEENTAGFLLTKFL